ncbi:hypothetical protein LZ30DRAFT_730228 [Colletotrichum cereale]|nr:hypothetical protein LZ30DRAFT_730228 [Colletotrichum cereale]
MEYRYMLFCCCLFWCSLGGPALNLTQFPDRDSVSAACRRGVTEDTVNELLRESATLLRVASQPDEEAAKFIRV